MLRSSISILRSLVHVGGSLSLLHGVAVGSAHQLGLTSSRDAREESLSGEADVAHSHHVAVNSSHSCSRYIVLSLRHLGLLVHAHEVTILVHLTSRYVRDRPASVHSTFNVTDSCSSLGVEDHSRLLGRSLHMTGIVTSVFKVSSSHSLGSERFKLGFSLLLPYFSSSTLRNNLFKESLF